MKGATENEAMKQFAAECVNTISSNMTDFEREIAGIPLQCRLLAECYTEQAIRWCQIRAPPTDSKPMGQIHSIFEMYERHMKMRLENQVEVIKNAHIYYALKLLFREQVHQFQSLKTPSISINELCAAGFFEATNSKNVQFVHRTFAEFFVAWLAVEMKMREKITPFLLDELLATKPKIEYIQTPFGKEELESHIFNYPVIAYFINGFTKTYSKNEEDHDQTSRLAMLINSVYYGQVSRIFHASAVSDYQFVPLLVSLCFDPLQISEKVNSDILTLLLISAKFSSVALVNRFCSQVELTELKCPYLFGLVEVTPLHVAVQRGHYHLVEFLAGKYGLALKNLRYLLHFCLFESLKDNKETVADKGQIIKLLCRNEGVWLNEKLSDGTVPLFQKNVNCELIKCLIESGADINVLDQDENTILHKIVENPVTPEFYHWLVVSLNERKFIYFNQPNSSGRKVRPLHCALEKVDLLKDTLKYFQLNSVDFNVEDGEKESPLFYAIRGGRSVSLICALIELGADLKKRIFWDRTLLHICAVHGHYQATKHFLGTLKMDVNAKNEIGGTPLHYAVKRRSTDYELIQQFLITSGADVNGGYLYERPTKLSLTHRLMKALQLNLFSQCSDSSPFMEALRHGEGLTWRTIKLMEKHGLSIGAKQASQAINLFLSNSSINSWENVDEFLRVLQFLIEKGGVIEDIPDPGSTVYTAIWRSMGVQRNMRAIIQTTDLDCLRPHLETSGLLTKFELEAIQKQSTDPFKKCELFYELVKSKKGSFERTCTLLRASSQMSPLTLLRHSLYSALTSHKYMFLTAPTFTNQFLLSPTNSNSNKLALVTNNSFLTIKRVRETISEKVVEINEADISSYLQKPVHEDLTVLKVRVVTSELISSLETNKVAQCKIIFVCSAVNEGVENCHIVTDTLSTWDEFSTQYFKVRTEFDVLYKGWTLFELFESPLILNNVLQLHRIIGGFPYRLYAVMKYESGHNDLDFQSKRYLCPSIFHFVLSDKLVFHGIPIEKLKESARFGHKIGTFGEDDVDDLDFVLIEHSQQFDEICKQTSENVHLVEYEQETCYFKLAKTFGWDENIQMFVKQQLCEGFPHCDCAPGNQNHVVSLLFKTSEDGVTFRSECLLPINELTPNTLKMMKLEDAEELFNIRSLLKRMSGETQVEQTDFIGLSHREQIVQLVTEHFSPLLVERALYHIAINTLFPKLAKQTNVIEELEKYEQLGMLKQTNNKQTVFVYKSLAWYFIAKLLIGLPETIEGDGITSALRNEILQNCFEFQNVKFRNGHNNIALRVITGSAQQKLSFYKFINRICFRFIDALLKKTADRKIANFSNFLRNIVAVDQEGNRWIHACVNANLFHLLQLILFVKSDALSSICNFELLAVLAVHYADVPITRLVAEQFEKQTKRKLTEIKIHFEEKEISLVSLATLRGNYGLVEYLLNEQGFRHQLKNVIRYCLEDTIHISDYEVNERKRIIDLLLPTDQICLEQILRHSLNIHVDLIVYLINLGVDIYAKDDDNINILFYCLYYLTPQEYHEVVNIIHAKDCTSIARLLKEGGLLGVTAFHVAVKHFELLDETISLFSEAQVDFNALDKYGDSVFVYAVKNLRSARLLDALYRSGADIHAKDRYGQPASVYSRNNQTALRYLSSRGVEV